MPAGGQLAVGASPLRCPSRRPQNPLLPRALGGPAIRNTKRPGMAACVRWFAWASSCAATSRSSLAAPANSSVPTTLARARAHPASRQAKSRAVSLSLAASGRKLLSSPSVRSVPAPACLSMTSKPGKWALASSGMLSKPANAVSAMPAGPSPAMRRATQPLAPSPWASPRMPPTCVSPLPPMPKWRGPSPAPALRHPRCWPTMAWGKARPHPGRPAPPAMPPPSTHTNA